MGRLTVVEPAVVGQLKNCSRCGQDFTEYSLEGRARVCPTCKSPRPRTPRPLRGSRGCLLGHPLTVRERQIVELIVQGRLNKEIAWDLHLSPGTVKVFLGPIFAKAGVSNRTSLAVWWLRQVKLLA